MPGTCQAFGKADEQLLLATENKIIDVTDPEDVQSGIKWWLLMTQRGGEGIVVKPLNLISEARRA